MNQIRIIQTHLPRIAALALVVLQTACTLEIVQTTATEAVADTADNVIQPAAAAVVPPGATVTATFAPPTVTSQYPPAFPEPLPTVTPTTAPALAGGEWLMVTTEQGLWIARTNGSKASIRTRGRVILPGPLSDAISPAGDLFAYITSSNSPLPEDYYRDLTLNIMSLSGAGPTVKIPLTSPATEPQVKDPFGIAMALIAEGSLAWSPDGRRLAFIGAQEGSSADLYEYYRDDGRIVRLSDGPDQAYRPLWSPDGAWIVHNAAGSFGSGAGYGVTGFYAARADDGGIISLYDIGERSGDEVGVGWLDDHTLVAHTWYATCGPQNLRLVDLSTSTVDFIFEGCMSDVAMGKNAVLFAQSENAASSDAEPPPGSVYLLTASDRRPRLIGTQKIRWIEWAEEIGAFLARTMDSGILEISPAGYIRELPATSSYLPVVAPGGRWWAGRDSVRNNDGIYVSEYGTELRQIYAGRIAFGRAMLFSPDGDSLFFITPTGDLFRAQAPNWAPALLASGLTPDFGSTDMAWWEG
jgi:hypothetical protein